MAAKCVVKLDEDGSVTDLFDGDPKQNFDIKGDDEKGELIMKDDQCVKIAYQVQNDTVTFTVTKSPRLFKDGDQMAMLKTLFG